MRASLVFLLLLAGCVNTAWDLKNLQSRYEGMPLASLYRQWGLPEAEARLPDGNTLSEYLSQRQVCPNHPDGWTETCRLQIISDPRTGLVLRIDTTGSYPECQNALLAGPGVEVNRTPCENSRGRYQD